MRYFTRKIIWYFNLFAIGYFGFSCVKDGFLGQNFYLLISCISLAVFMVVMRKIRRIRYIGWKILRKIVFGLLIGG